MKNHIRLFVLIAILFLFALALPFNLSAQNDEDLETLAVGDTVERVRSEAEFLLDAEEGQTVTLRWDGSIDIYANCPDSLFFSTIDVQTELTNAAGDMLPQIDLLYLKDATIEAYALEGAPPYRLSSTICGGERMTLTVLDGNTISHNEQPALSIGERLQIAGSSIQEGELVVFPLNVQEGDVFTVNTHYLNSTLLHDEPMYFAVVRDGNGQIVPSDFSGRFRGDWATQFPVYTVTGALPYRLDFVALFPVFGGYTPTNGEITSDISFSAQLLAGNTVIEDGGLVEPGSRLDVSLPDLSSARFYTLEVEDGDIVTLHSEFRMDSALYETFWDGNGEPVDPTSFYAPNSQNNISVGVAVYQLDGPQPYTLLFTGQGSTTLVVDAGDTLERRELATLAPGGLVQGIVPPFDDVMNYIALDVDPEATVTLNWNVPDTAYLIKDGTDNWMDFQNADPVTDHYGVFNLSRGTPPFVVVIDQPAGQPYTLTLAEGDTPLSPDAATASGNAETAVQGDTQSETVPDTPTVFCRISGNDTVNQRSGPGTDFELAGELTAGTNADVDGQATGTDGFIWWRLGESVWVRSDVVDEVGDCESVSVVQP